MQFGPCGHILQGGPDIRLVRRQHGCLSPLHALVAQDAPRPGKSNALCNRKMARRSTRPNVREGSLQTFREPKRMSALPLKADDRGHAPPRQLWAISGL